MTIRTIALSSNKAADIVSICVGCSQDHKIKGEWITSGKGTNVLALGTYEDEGQIIIDTENHDDEVHNGEGKISIIKFDYLDFGAQETGIQAAFKKAKEF